MDKYIILWDVSKEGLKQLDEMRKQGLLKILEQEAIVVDCIPYKEMREIVQEALDEYEIEVSDDTIDVLIDYANEIWECSENGIPREAVYDAACAAIERTIKDGDMEA